MDSQPHRTSKPLGEILSIFWLISISAISSLAFPKQIQALDLSAGGALAVQERYNDNVRMSPNDKLAVTGTDFMPSISLGAADETSQATFDTQLNLQRYNRPEFNTNDQNEHLDLKESLERDNFEIEGRAIHDSSLTSELLDSGRVGDKAVGHQQYQANPSWTHTLTERNQLTLQGAYESDRYANDTSGNFTDYSYWQTSLRWTFVFNERVQLYSVLNHSDYQSAQQALTEGQSYATQDVDNGLQIGGQYTLSEKFNISGLIGRTRDQTNYDVKDPLQACAIFGGQPFILTIFGEIAAPPGCELKNNNKFLSTANGSLSWAGEKQQISATIAQDTHPSSQGYTYKSLQLILNWNYTLNEKSSVSADITAGQNRSLGKAASTISQEIDRNFAYVDANYNYQFIENWYVNFGLQYQYQNYTSESQAANSKAVVLGIRYQPVARHWSR